MTQWTAFVGATGLALAGFLVLARLSEATVENTSSGASADHRRPDRRSRERPSDERGAPDAGEPSDSGPASDADATGDGTAGEPTPVDAAGGPAGRGETDGPATVASLSPGELLANVALTQGLFGSLLAAAAWYFGVPATALGLWGGRVDGVAAVAVGAAVGVALWVGNEFASAAADAAGAAYDEGLRALLAPADARGWLLLLGATLPVIAVVEEFLFRAAAVGATSAAVPVSPWALAVVSSGAFALGHGAQGRVGVAVTGALGFALAATYVLTGSLVVVVVAHYLVNALEFGLHEGMGLPDPVWSGTA